MTIFGNMTDRQFDDKIREMLAEPQEQLPEGLWEGIEARLDAAETGRRKASRAVSWRRVVAGVSSVAAAVALMFVCGHLWKTGTVEDGLLSDNAVSDNVAAGDCCEADVGEGTAVSDDAAFDVVAPSDVDSGHLLAMASGTAIVSMEEPKAERDDSVATARASDDGREAPVPVVDASGADVEGVLVDVDSEAAPECEIRVDNSDIEAAYGREDAGGNDNRHHPIELSVGGNSFGGPQKGTGARKMFARGNRDNFAGKNFVEGANSDSYSLPLSFGVGVRYGITKWLGVGIGVNYTLLNKKVSGVYYDEDSVCHSTDMKNSQHYIGIPLEVYFSMFRTQRWDVYATVGGSVEKCVMNRYSGMLEGEHVFYNRKVGGIQTSVKAGLGFEFSPVDFLGLYIDPSVRYYFDNNQPRSIRTAQPLAFGVEAGLRFKL